jgi:hypothetical protein
MSGIMPPWKASSQRSKPNAQPARSTAPGIRPAPTSLITSNASTTHSDATRPSAISALMSSRGSPLQAKPRVHQSGSSSHRIPRKSRTYGLTKSKFLSASPFWSASLSARKWVSSQCNSTPRQPGAPLDPPDQHLACGAFANPNLRPGTCPTGLLPNQAPWLCHAEISPTRG